jgi:hypothetical protein
MVVFLLKKYWMEVGEWDLGIFSSFKKAKQYAETDFLETCIDEGEDGKEALVIEKIKEESTLNSECWKSSNDVLPDVWYYIESYLIDGAIVTLSSLE